MALAPKPTGSRLLVQGYVTAVFPDANVFYDHGGDVESYAFYDLVIDREINVDHPNSSWRVHRVVPDYGGRDAPPGADLEEIGRHDSLQDAVIFAIKDAVTHRLAVVAETLAMESSLFSEWADRWKRETAHMSSIDAMVRHEDYQRIIALGEAAVGPILRDLRDNGPNHWFPALCEITGASPVPRDESGNMHQMTVRWLMWGAVHGYSGECLPRTRRTCPDEGMCHHECPEDGGCWRVKNCEPLSGVFPGDKWPVYLEGG